MKISAIQIPKVVKSAIVAVPLLVSAPTAIALNNYQKSDTFEKSINYNTKYPHKLDMSPRVKVAGENIYPAIVIDKSKKTLYLYDLETYLDTTYTVNLGNLSKTTAGLRVITSIENNESEDEAGSQIIKLGVVDKKTGKISDYNGGVIKGRTSDENQVETNIKMQEMDVKNLTNRLFEGQFVLIKE